MQKVEKWRVEELDLLLKELCELLRKGDNCEWANVFSHFNDETKIIISKNDFDLNSLENLIKNIRNSFSHGISSTTLTLSHENTEMKKRLNQDFLHMRACILGSLKDMEYRTIETIN
jgi:CRISPR/Cas system-associated protein Cas10 (large subunit of type III CRISPR-Cas system)